MALATIPSLVNGTFRCGVNTSGYSTGYPALRQASVPLVTDLSSFIAIHPAGTPPGKTQYDTALAALIAANPSLILGRYISGQRTQAAALQYPNESVLAADVPGIAMRPDDIPNDIVSYVDLDVSAARTAFVTAITNAHNAFPRPVVYLDNMIHPMSLPGWVTWANTTTFLSSLKTSLNAAATNALLIANIAFDPAYLDDTDLTLLVNSVDGFSCEIPYSINARASASLTSRLITVYRTMLDAGKTVVLVNVPPPGIDADQNSVFLAAFVMAIRKPTDLLFLSRSFYQENLEWENWPSVAGQATHGYQLGGSNVQISRAYQNAIVTSNGNTSIGTLIRGRRPFSNSRKARRSRERGER